jgi:hypothetical protein
VGISLIAVFAAFRLRALLSGSSARQQAGRPMTPQEPAAEDELGDVRVAQAA